MEQEKDEMVQTVFTIKHEDIPKGRTQCEKHEWQPLNENEMYCPRCESAIIVKDI